MRKEKLLLKKNNERENMTWYLKNTMTNEELKLFSLSQLKVLSEIFQRAEKYRESKNPFYTLSATEVLHKESGKIAEFMQDDNFNYVGIREESEEEILNGAARTIYKKYMENI